MVTCSQYIIEQCILYYNCCNARFQVVTNPVMVNWMWNRLKSFNLTKNKSFLNKHLCPRLYDQDKLEKNPHMILVNPLQPILVKSSRDLSKSYTAYSGKIPM